MLASERKKYIADLLRRQTAVRVAELSERLGSSEVTIRRDLQELEAQGVLKRTHGGAIRPGNTGTAFEAGYEIFAGERVEQKRAIAKAAYELIEDHDSIMLDPSTTTACLAEYLWTGEKRDLTVVTNSVRTAAKLMDCAHVKLIQIGGQVRKNVYSCIGPFAEEMVKSLRADKAFIGMNGIDPEGGVMTTPNLFEAQMKQAMIASAGKTYILADSSKIGRNFLSTVCRISDVYGLVTDSEIPRDTADRLRGEGIEVRIAREE